MSSGGTDVHATDWKKEKLSILIDAAVHAINRARYVFIVSNITGILILVGLFNSTFAWLRNAIERAKGRSDLVSHLQKTLYEDLWTINIPLLGSKISVFDLSIVASTALLVISV